MADLTAHHGPTGFAGPPARLAGVSDRSTIVARTRLDAHFELSTGRVVRLLAPGGYGKSTLIARWITRDERDARWLELEPIDNDPLVLTRALSQVLCELCSAPPPRAGTQHFGRLVAESSEPFILVLDGIHHIQGAESAAVVDQVIQNLPLASTLVISGRGHRHAGRIAKFRLEPGVIDLGAADLAFDLTETEHLMASMGVDADVDVVTDLATQFEGWPAGLRLAGMVMAGRFGAGVPVPQLGSTAYVTDYITQEWFGGLNPTDQRFLLGLGCLEHISPESCVAIFGSTDAASVLHRLCHDEMVLSAMDREEHAYRLHPLLRSWLSARLRDQDDTRWVEIHLQASHWWELQGDIDLAFDHAANANDLERCEELTIAYAGLYCTRGMERNVSRWLSEFGHEQISGSPRLQIVSSIVALGLLDVRTALSWARLAWRQVSFDDDADGQVDDQARLQAEALHAALEPAPAADLIPHLEHAHANLATGPWHAFTGLALGATQYLCGDVRALDTLRESVFEHEVGQLTITNANAASSLAIILDMNNRREEAADLCADALVCLDTQPGHTFPAAGLAQAMAALIDARAGRHAQALERLTVSRTTLGAFDNVAPWFQVLGFATLVRVALFLDEAQLARELLHPLGRLMEIQDPDTPFAESVRELHDRVEVANALQADRSWSLTSAEMRVVQYLPSNLSLADIAERLFVSRNTVKSHAAAIYRKLGATSRGGAVDRARRAGLLDDGGFSS